MKKLILFIFLIGGISYAQTLTANARKQDISDSLTAYTTNIVKPLISDSLQGTSIGNADSLGSAPASDYLTWSDTSTTPGIATQADLAAVTGGSLSDSITAHRTEIDAEKDSTTAQRTDINAITTLASNKFYLGNGSNIASEVTLSGDVTSSNDGTMAIASGVIVNADINASANIDASKLGDGSVSNTEFNYLDGVTSALQTQIDNLEVGTLSSLSDGTILIGDAANEAQERTLSGDVTVSNLGVTAIGSGVIVDADINNSAAIDASKIGNGDVSNTELSYVNGLTSAAQTQLTTNAGNISTNASNISSNSDSITAHRSDINTNTSSISTNAGNISTNSSSISANSDSITAHRSELSTNTSNIATNITDIDALEALANGKIYIGNGSNVAAEVTPSGDVTITNTGTTAITGGVIVNSDVNASAAIDAAKIHDGSISNTEFGYLNGATSNLQTQISANTDSITSLNTLTSTYIYIGNSSNNPQQRLVSGDIVLSEDGVATLQSATVSNANVASGANIDASKIGTGVISNTEFNYLNGVESNIQTQFNNIDVDDSIKLRTENWSWTIPSPQSSEEIPLHQIPYGVTVDSVTAVLIGSSTPSVTFNIYHGGTALFSSSQTCNDYSASTINITSNDVYSSFSDNTMDSASWLHLEIGTVSGTVNYIVIVIWYKET